MTEIAERIRTPTSETILQRFSARMVDLSEQWFPDAYVFVLIAVVAVALGAIVHGASPLTVSRAFGDGFWNLIPFTMQMALVAIGGFVVAMSPPVAWLMRRMALMPTSGRSAVVFVGVLSILLSLVNWGVSLIFSGLLVREIARRSDIKLDYRAAASRWGLPPRRRSCRPMRPVFPLPSCRSPV
jgi:short-chain fatty acids transporter